VDPGVAETEKTTANRLAASGDRGIRWLEGRALPDGSFGGAALELSAYYKSLLAFALCGRIEAGTRSLGYLRAHLVGADGALSSEGGTKKTANDRMAANLANYMDGWVAIGAWQMGDYELADRICVRLHGDQSDTHGGILTGPERWSGPPRYDLATTASCGRAFLIAGHRDQAVRAGEFLVQALSRQHDPSTGLDVSFDDQWRPLGPPDPQARTYYRYDLTRRAEKVWFPAFSSAFLCELYQLTGEPGMLVAARGYFEFIVRGPEFQGGTLANGKSGWAAGLLAQATGEPDYLRARDSIVTNVLARQRPDGEFVESPAYRAVSTAGELVSGPPASGRRDGDGPTASQSPAELGRRLERTAEFTTWVAEFLRSYVRLM